METKFALFMVIAMFIAAPSSASLVTFIFGDLLTEDGNNNHLQLPLAKSNYPHYGVEFDGEKPTGKFTTGKTIGDIISNKIGILPPPPYLSVAPNDDAILKMVNYASGGTGILNDKGLHSIQSFLFDDQIRNFESTKQSLKAKIGDEGANKLGSEALFFIGIHSNYYVNNFLQPFLEDGQQYTHGEFLELLISTLGQQLTSLYEVDAKKMVFQGLGPLGSMPSQKTISSRGVCLNQVNVWVQQFNSRATFIAAPSSTSLKGVNYVTGGAGILNDTSFYLKDEGSEDGDGLDIKKGEEKGGHPGHAASV